MESIKIRHALEEKGYSQKKLSDELNVTKTMIYLVIQKKTTSCRIKNRIAEIIQKPFIEVWGNCEKESA